MPNEKSKLSQVSLGLDVGVFSVKAVLIEKDAITTAKVPISGRPVEAAGKCIEELLEGKGYKAVNIGIMGQNARLVAETMGIKTLLEIEALQAGLDHENIKVDYVLSLGHENMHYLEFDDTGKISFFSRNGQCAAGSGSFWYQQATRMGYNDRELAEVAVEAETAVPISGRCAVFAKSDMTHAINEGATQSAVSAGMARALIENVITSVAQNRINGPGLLAAIGGVANNKAVLKYLVEFCENANVEVMIPDNHEYINAIGAAVKGDAINISAISGGELETPAYKPENSLPPLDPERVHYLNSEFKPEEFDLSQVYLGVDCGSVSTKCVLLDREGRQIGGVYLPTTGRPALQVLELMKQVDQRYGDMIGNAPITACTTGSGRFLSQRILNAEYAVDEITCQAEGIKQLFKNEKTLSIIEIGGEDSKFIQLQNGILSDYSMNPVCAAGTGTFLENLAELLGISIKDEFSDKAFSADYAVDLGDICTLISQSILASASARGLPLNEQLASLAYSSGQNYLSKTVDKRPLKGKLVFAGATAKNHALAAALAAISEKSVYVPPEPELTGALGSALMARQFHLLGRTGEYTFRSLTDIREFSNTKAPCKAECKHEHNCVLNIIKFADGKKFVYGDRCGRYSGLDKKEERLGLPDYAKRRLDLMEKEAGENWGTGPTVGIARCGLYFDYYPFLSTFFSRLGCRVVRSGETTSETLQKGKVMLDSEMCYPMKVIIGHYRELKENDPDYIFLPEVVDVEALPWGEQWPRAFTCPLLQTLRGTVTNSLDLNPEKVLYSQLNFRYSYDGIKEQLRETARRVLGEEFDERRYLRALKAAYNAQESFRRELAAAGEKMLEELKENPEHAPAVFLSRSYTLYDGFISKKSMRHARESGLMAVPHEYLVAYLQAWFAGEISSPYLDPYRTELEEYLKEQVDRLYNIYPAQLQKMLSAVFLINFLNERSGQTGLPQFNLVLLDPFKCGPNAMLRHYLNEMTNYLRLTIDEHTAAAGMITRLEAFRNTCLSKKETHRPILFTSQTRLVTDNDWNKIVIPHPTYKSNVIAAMFRRYGVEADVLPRSSYGDLSLAQRYANGEECLPFIQNLQDYLEYLQSSDGGSGDGEVFFQGWACGPCRYGLYAPTQSLAISRAGYGERKVCAIKFADIVRRFGFGFVLGLYHGLLATDLLYKMLHRVRPYEKEPGSAESLLKHYAERLAALMEEYEFKPGGLLTGSYRKPIENLIREAAEAFDRIPVTGELRPRILLGGEFYVRLDDRCNQRVIEKIEQAGGEVCLAPATEVFTYTLHIYNQEARQDFALNRRPADFIKQTIFSLLSKLAHRDEVALERAGEPLLEGLEEPAPPEIMEHAFKYVSRHYGGEPPMTIGRVAAFADRERVSGAIFVAPFTCMPSSVVEAQQRLLQDDLGLPVITVYYDGKENTNRDEMVEGLVFQARQKLLANTHRPA